MDSLPDIGQVISQQKTVVCPLLFRKVGSHCSMSPPGAKGRAEGSELERRVRRLSTHTPFELLVLLVASL